MEKEAPKILIIDDSQLTIAMLHSGLRQHGFEVAVASDGDEGLLMLKRESPDLIILDMHMPSMSGREFLKALKDLPGDPPVPVIVITASEPTHDLVDGSNVRACYHKPIPMAQLIAKINECLEKRNG